MKILMVSMASLHFFRWTDQLKDSGHEVYWFDILDGGKKVDRIAWVHQKVSWKRRWNYPGRFFIKKRFPKLYALLQKGNERKTDQVFEAFLKEIQPDVVHSFVLYLSCAPILKVMKKYPQIKWLYSAWGNDLFYYQNNTIKLNEIKACLPHIDYMFADCARDIAIARNYGFNETSLGVFPGGGGYQLSEISKFRRPFNDRNIILIKGYEHHFGRCNVVLKSLITIQQELKNYKIFVYGDNEKVLNFVEEHGLDSWPNFTLLGKLNQQELIKLKGEALIYIGNSISDGMPNTLLEAIIMGAFPIQSNLGGATSEIIENKKNGLLIDNPLDSEHIASLLLYAISNHKMLSDAFFLNITLSKSLDYGIIREQVLRAYESILINEQT